MVGRWWRCMPLIGEKKYGKYFRSPGGSLVSIVRLAGVCVCVSLQLERHSGGWDPPRAYRFPFARFSTRRNSPPYLSHPATPPWIARPGAAPSARRLRLAPKIRTLPRRHLILTTPCKLDDCLVYGNHQPRRDHGCSSSSSTTRLLVLPPLLELGDDNRVPVRSSTSQGSTQAPGRWTARARPHWARSP
jgi:hypothetical protein